MNDELKDKIKHEVELLKDKDDCICVIINDNRGLFIKVVDYGEGMQYLVELNDIDFGDISEPCADYNAFSEFGDIDTLVNIIDDYLKDNSINL